MGRSDDSISRRKNKKNRRNQQDNNKVSNRVAAIIAAKKRRLSGKRRLCQGMCYSLPTPEDPFNDGHGKIDPIKKGKRRPCSKAEKMPNENKKLISKKRPSDSNHTESDLQEQKKAKVNNMENNEKLLTSLGSTEQRILSKLGKGSPRIIVKVGPDTPQVCVSEDHVECPSKFLILCLNTIQKTLQHDKAFTYEEDKPFFVDTWGVEFWKSYVSGKDVLETSRPDASVEQIAWIASTAADTISRKEKEGQSFASPFLLYLVPTQEKASKVRKICKPLKARGIHTVSLHPGASVDHQIQGLKSCEPEFLVSTPERLLELVSLSAVDISGVSLLVIEGLETPSEGGYHDTLLSIRQFISGSLQTVVFSDCLNLSSIPFMQNILQGSACRLSASENANALEE